jgi:hypothetical protein
MDSGLQPKTITKGVADLVSRIQEAWANKTTATFSPDEVKRSKEDSVFAAIESGVLALHARLDERGYRREAGKQVAAFLKVKHPCAWIVQHNGEYVAICAIECDQPLGVVKGLSQSALLQILVETVLESGTPMIIQEGTAGLAGTDSEWDGSEYFVCSNCPEQHFTDNNVFENLIKQAK